MYSKAFLILAACVVLLLGGLTSTTTTTTFVAAMSIANQDLERYFRTANATQTFGTLGEERIAMDVFNYAFLNWSYADGLDLVESDYKEEQARYGEGRIMNVNGKLIHISNVDDTADDFACTPYIRGTLGAPTPPKGIPWIALVRRGRCTFEDKVKHVYAQNAIGVIIYNDKQVMQLEKMQIKSKNRNITAVITYQKVGIELANIVDKGNDLHIAILEGRNGMRPISTLNRTSVLFVSISFIVLMIISLVWLIFYYIQRFRYLQAKDQQSRTLCSVTKKAIMKIPTKTGKMTDEKDLDSDCCAICIEAYKPSDIIRILPCKHEFHKTCIDPWLIEHRTCPMCKLDVLRFYGYVVGDQIQQTPSPLHMAPAAVNYAQHIVENNAQRGQRHEVPVLVVAVSPPQQQQQLSLVGSAIGAATATATPLSMMLDQPNSNRFNASSSHSPRSISNDQQQQQQQNGRRNSAPATVVLPHVIDSHQEVSTASRQFLGSEESILEYEPDRTNAVANAHNNGGGGIGTGSNIGNSQLASTSAAMTNQNSIHPPTRAGALADLIRSRDFVIDFPRVFVLESGSVVGERNTLFPTRLPERSQSSMSLQHCKDWVTSVTNKLEEQHGLRRLPKDDMQENLLSIRDSMRQRRSRSADGRYTNVCFMAREQVRRERHEMNNDQLQQQQYSHLVPPSDPSNGTETLARHNSVVELHGLTEAAYAQSRQRQLEGNDNDNDNDSSFVASSSRRFSATRRGSHYHYRTNSRGRGRGRGFVVSQSSNDSTASSPPDVNIQIQINGEGVNLE